MKDQFRDTNSKDIWEDRLLLSQFLKSYTGISIFENVQPEDIEDETERFRYLLGIEFEGDTVKRIRLRGREPEMPVYVIALLDHKSEVDHDVTFQLLKYMVGIWAEYRNSQNAEHKGSSAGQSFRYPLIVPIVYYEGAARWTAAMNWKERVAYSEVLGQFVPDFTYSVFRLHECSSDEILSKHEELSLIMLLNRIQTAEDLDAGKWTQSQQEAAQEILRDAPENVVRLLANLVHHIGVKLNLPKPELDKFIRSVEDRKMGVLWANMEKMDIQEERRLRIEAQEKLDKATAEMQEKYDALRRELDEYIRSVEDRKTGVLWANMEKTDIQEERRLRIEAQEKCDALQRELDETRERLRRAEHKEETTAPFEQ